MAKLAAQHELTPAVSNVKINARGDEIGPNGQIIRATHTDDIPSSGTPVQSHRIPEPMVKPKPHVLAPITTPVTQSTPVPFVSTSTELVKTEDLQNGLKEKHKGKA
jgi:hypothetical protein